MGAFTKEVVYHKGYPSEYTLTHTNWLGKLTIAAVGAASLHLLLGDSRMDLLGDAPRDIAEGVAVKEATTNYEEIFGVLDPAEKFSVQYGGTTKVSVRGQDKGNGLLGAIGDDSAKYHVEFNDGCLGGTAYDVNGGNIRFSFEYGGLFSYVRARANGEIPTAAAFAQVDASNSDLLHVASGNTNSVDLTFSGLTSGNALTPANAATNRILDTYGCELGYMDWEWF